MAGKQILLDGLQDLLQDAELGKDASGNTILADVGPWLRDQFKQTCKVISHLIK